MQAQMYLGWMYDKGDALQHTVTTYMWYKIAATNGHELARGGIVTRAAKRLTAEQLEKANERVKRCMASPSYFDCD